LASSPQVSEVPVDHKLETSSSQTIKIQLSVLVEYKEDIISSNITCSRHDMAEK
jgi:hypothetical protein